MYKLLAMDMDDTLLNSRGKISKINKQAIELARNKGVTVVLCSGRPSKSMKRFFNELGMNKKGEYFISYNGALIIDCFTNEIVFGEYIDKQIANQLIDIGRKSDVDIQLYTDDNLIVEKYTDRTKAYEKLTGMEAVVVNDLKQCLNDYVVKILFNNDNPKLLSIQKQIKKWTKDKLHMFLSRDYLLEFLSKKTNKGIAVLELGKKLNIKREEIIAVGDSFNDQYMIEMAGLGVTVSNGREEVKKVADYVTEVDNDNHVIMEIVEKFIL